MPALGMKSGPNIQFFKSIREISGYDFVMLNETDAFPQHEHWKTQLLSECKRGRDNIIIGSRYQGKVDLSGDIGDHLNGNAIYNLSHPLFREGLLDQWEKALCDACAINPDTAYDILFALLRNNPDYFEIRQRYPLLDRGIFNTSETSFICNASLPQDDDPDEINRIATQSYSILHGKQFLVPSIVKCIRSGEFLEENIVGRSRLFLDLDINDKNLIALPRKNPAMHQVNSDLLD